MGMTQGSLAAFERAFNEGVLTCGSILVPAPWFAGAAELCRKNPGWCVGVHLCLVGEWRGYRWRPVLPWSRVTSLVDEDGFLYGSPGELWSHGPKLAEIDAELRAQIDLALKKGIRVQYLDTHYIGLTDYPGLADMINKIASDYQLPHSSQLGEKRCKGIFTTPVPLKQKKALRMLQQLQPGLWLWVCHPGITSPEQEALNYADPGVVFPGGGPGGHRAEELRVLLSPEIQAIIKKRGITLTDYSELRRETGTYSRPQGGPLR
jgi:hypothetical protein